MAILHELRLLPSAHFRRSKYFYLRYDAAWLVVCLAALGLMNLYSLEPLASQWAWWFPAAFPVVTYVLILGHVFAHNASHFNFGPVLNRVVGEAAGVLILSRFASWQIIHERHHRYSDDVDKDPHPVHPSYWRTVIQTILNVERQLQTSYLEVHGDTPESRRRERIRALISYGTNIALIACWYRLLGSAFFFGLFVPASILGVLHLIHFNWVTHNALARNGDYKPVDLDHGIFKLGNLLFFGIYAHRVHHERPHFFNPAKEGRRLGLLQPVR